MVRYASLLMVGVLCLCLFGVDSYGREKLVVKQTGRGRAAAVNVNVGGGFVSASAVRSRGVVFHGVLPSRTIVLHDAGVHAGYSGYSVRRSFFDPSGVIYAPPRTTVLAAGVSDPGCYTQPTTSQTVTETTEVPTTTVQRTTTTTTTETSAGSSTIQRTIRQTHLP